MTGTLYGLGVGPGDPELITLKAHRLVSSCPVLAYPAPEQGESLARSIVAPHLPGGQVEIAMRMPLVADRFPSQAVYDDYSQIIGNHLQDGRDVAAVCEGDPFFYGSFMYLFGRIVGRFPVEVVPGVSSLTACAAALAVPLAARTDVLTVLPAPLDDDVLAARLRETDAAAIIKLGRHVGRVRDLLTTLGLLDGARYIERATMAEQRILPLAEVDPGDAPYFSMILVHRRSEAWR